MYDLGATVLEQVYHVLNSLILMFHWRGCVHCIVIYCLIFVCDYRVHTFRDIAFLCYIPDPHDHF